jgi:hypothetical protein
MKKPAGLSRQRAIFTSQIWLQLKPTATDTSPEMNGGDDVPARVAYQDHAGYSAP